MMIVSNLHIDHFDEVAQRLLPKNLPRFCQPIAEATIAEMGFRRVTPVREEVVWEGITITRTPGSLAPAFGASASTRSPGLS
jgi:hypothetical protein